MKRIITLLITGFLFLSIAASAQDTVSNGHFEQWRLKEFKCCGRNIDQPWYWGIAEQLTGLNYNKFTFRVVDSAHVHSGLCSIKLFSDTTYLNNLALIPGVIAYGNLTDSASTNVAIGPVVQSSGMAISSNPERLNFFMLMEHDATDTPYYMYVFTRWNLAQQKEDTLAYAQVDIPDAAENLGQWVEYTDSIHYTMAGTPDTVRLLFFGGRFSDARRQGNATFLDDVSFYYPTTGIVNLDGSAVLQVYPNPASNLVSVKTGQFKQGNVLRIFDAGGRLVKTAAIESYSTTIDISKLETGDYFYGLYDGSNTFLTRGKLAVVR